MIGKIINKTLDDIKGLDITISQWMIGFTGILFIRFLLEGISSPTTLGVISSDATTLVHYGLFFITTVLGLICIVGYFSKNYLGTSKLILFGLPIIWLAPIIDMVVSRGKGYKMTYIFDSHGEIIFDFLTFFGSQVTRGATIGIRIEIIIILCVIGWYIWHIRKNIYESIITVFFSYLLIFILAIIPGILYTLFNLQGQSGTVIEITNYLQNTIFNSNIVHNTLHEGASSLHAIRFFELGFNKFISQILFIISLIFTSIFFWKANPKKFISIIKNARVERVLFYVILLLCGAGFAYINGYGNIKSWVDVLSLIILILSWCAVWLYAVHSNDIVDIKIDEISNPERPLVKGELSVHEMRESGYVFLVISLLGSWLAGFYPFFMNLVYIATSYIYSTPPLRLRRFPILSSFLISVACLATILAGFFFISVDKRLGLFPGFVSIGILIIFTLITNIRDLKDVEGDKKDGVYTLATIFGQKANQIIGLCFAIAILLVPIFLSLYIIFITAIPTAIIGYRIMVKKPFVEKNIFILGFVFLLSIMLLFLGIYWLAYFYKLV